MTRRALTRLALTGLAVLALPLAGQQPDSTPRRVIELDSLVVRARRMTQLGPLPGLRLRHDQIAGNVQGATQLEIRRSGAVGLTDFLGGELQSIHLNDYQGNPLQADVVFRGFSASPQIGTPQGLSVFLDGVRVNEAFGDVVNWDLLPLNAIARMDVFPGSNPLFGLNTLGGAITLRTRSGFQDQGVEAIGTGGAFGRRQVKLAAGGARGAWAAFGAVTGFDEAGWRDNSNSTMKQGFLRLDHLRGSTLFTLSALLASNDLIGNGLLPYEMWRLRPGNVFTSPDQTRNRLAQFTLQALWNRSERMNISLQAYRRTSNRYTTAGTVYQDFQNMDGVFDKELEPEAPTQPLCHWLDANHDGEVDTDVVVDPYLGDTTYIPVKLDTMPCQNGVSFEEGGPRNGNYDASPGVVEGTPVSLINHSGIEQLVHGAAIQANWNLPRHKAMVGASVDWNRGDYRTERQLGLFDDFRRAYTDPAHIHPMYFAAQRRVPLNDFHGTSATWSLYGSETWSPRDNLHVTGALRFNHTALDNQLDVSVFPGYLHWWGSRVFNTNVVPQKILCPTRDLASCPASPLPADRPIPNLAASRTADAFTYRSLNPNLGVTWSPSARVNLYGNWSRGARTPSVTELGCAYDGTPVDVNAGQVDQNGDPLPPRYVPRSLLGPACTLPFALSGDPYLKQIRSTAWEAGARGTLGRWEWNAAVYRTDLSNDIALEDVGNVNFFRNIGKTRRQGVELGARGSVGPVRVRAGYALTDATYRTRHWVQSAQNSSADFNRNSQPGSQFPNENAAKNGGVGTYNTIQVDPGAHLPGVPIHNLNLGLDLELRRGWDVGLGMSGHSRAYLRGNENNLHRPRDDVYEIYQWSGSTGGSGTIYTGGNDSILLPRFRQAGTVPGFAVFTLRTSVRIGPDAVVSAQVNNLFNASYFSAGRLGVSPFAPSVLGAIGPGGFNYKSTEWSYTSFVAPGAPRGLWLTVTYAMPNGGL